MRESILNHAIVYTTRINNPETLGCFEDIIKGMSSIVDFEIAEKHLRMCKSLVGYTSGMPDMATVVASIYISMQIISKWKSDILAPICLSDHVSAIAGGHRSIFVKDENRKRLVAG